MNVKSIAALAIAALSIAALASAGSGAGDALMAPETVTLDKLKSVLAGAGHQVQVDGKWLKLDDGKGHAAHVNLDADKKLISFVLWFNFRPMVSRGNRMKLMNDINREVIVTRACIDDQDDLRFDYWLGFENGITEKQIAGALKTFLASSDAALRLKDTADLIK